MLHSKMMTTQKKYKS